MFDLALPETLATDLFEDAATDAEWGGFEELDLAGASVVLAEGDE